MKKKDHGPERTQKDRHIQIDIDANENNEKRKKN